jgi:hypothetical protein
MGEYLPKFLKMVVPSLAGSSIPRRTAIFVERLDPQMKAL